MIRIMPKVIAEHIYHQKHRADEIQHSGNDSVPVSLRIAFVWCRGRSIDLHTCCNRRQKPGADVPKCDRRWKRNDITDLLGEVEEQEDVPEEAANE